MRQDCEELKKDRIACATGTARLLTIGAGVLLPGWRVGVQPSQDPQEGGPGRQPASRVVSAAADTSGGGTPVVPPGCKLGGPQHSVSRAA